MAEDLRGYLFYMIQFAEVFPDEQIVIALRAQLSWTHFRELIAIEDPLKREFYAEMCRAERWSTRTLRTRSRGWSMSGRLCKKPDEVIRVEIAALGTRTD